MFSTELIVGIGIGLVLGVVLTIVWLIVFGKDSESAA